ncbi:hypothetical protein [Wolbachia pipientis]|nr:hypothetical protein [Wolbachia pipientis]
MHKKLDPSVTHWDDKKRSAGMTPYLTVIPRFIRGISSTNT